MLQTRNAKRTGFAAVRFAVDLVNEGLITKEEALSAEADSGRRPEPAAAADLRSRGQEEGRRRRASCWPRASTPAPAPPRARSASTPPTPRQLHGSRTPTVELILVRRETSPEDLRGMKVAKGILTAFGGASSHAALVSRQMGKVCIVGCGELDIDYARRHASPSAGKVLKDGDWISIDGFTGEVFAGQVATKPSEVVQVLINKTLEAGRVARSTSSYAQADELGRRASQAEVRTNADQPDQAAAGDRLRRRGHRPVPHRAHVLRPHRRYPRDDPGRRRAKAARRRWPSCCRSSASDFDGLFRAMKGRPVTIRLLDPPLHEFLPHDDAGAGGAGQEARQYRPRRSPAACKELHEFNPMLGHRGCRLGIVYPGDHAPCRPGRSSRPPAT